MKLRWQIEVPFTFIGETRESIQSGTLFEHDGLTVRFSFSGDTPTETDDFPDNRMHFYMNVKKIHFFLEGNGVKQITDSKSDAVLLLLTSITNRVLRNIRNFGFVWHINEYYTRGFETEAEDWIRHWKVEISDDGTAWSLIVAPDPQKEYIFMIRGEWQGRMLFARYWPHIEEGIQDNLDLPPEQEFVVNAYEYGASHNYRLGLLESIVCLEIVLTQYLRIYLSTRMKIPKKRIDNFLTPQLGLSARVSALLNLCLDDNDLRKIDFRGVLQAINWRNNIIHKTGHLPKNITEDAIRESIRSIIKLVRILGRRRLQVEAAPEMKNIGDEISKKLNVPTPSISKLDRHQVSIAFTFLEIPENVDILTRISEEAVALLSAHDSRFNPSEHLKITYGSFLKGNFAEWADGHLTVHSPNE